MALNTTVELIHEIAQGRMIVLMDDEDRENEGDLVMAASFIQAEHINFMAKYGRGLICLTLTAERCRQLKLPLMVSETNFKHSTNFTLSIEAAQGVTTGISAADRARTIQAAVAPNAVPEDLVQPGHIFPIMAQPDGVLIRAGHTEAGCDLTRLAGLESAAVIVEILNEDGSMARRPQLELFAKEHHLKIGTIADLIEHRFRNERTLEPMARCDVANDYGQFKMHAYQDHRGHMHYALVKGDIKADEPILVRVHMQDHLADWLHVKLPQSGWPLHRAMALIGKAKHGVLLVLSTPYSAEENIRRLRQSHLAKDKVLSHDKDAVWDLRTFGIGAQILKDIGVVKMRVISSPMKLHALSGFGLEITEYVAIEQ